MLISHAKTKKSINLQMTLFELLNTSPRGDPNPHVEIMWFDGLSRCCSRMSMFLFRNLLFDSSRRSLPSLWLIILHSTDRLFNDIKSWFFLFRHEEFRRISSLMTTEPSNKEHASTIPKKLKEFVPPNQFWFIPSTEIEVEKFTY